MRTVKVDVVKEYRTRGTMTFEVEEGQNAEAEAIRLIREGYMDSTDSCIRWDGCVECVEGSFRVEN